MEDFDKVEFFEKDGKASIKLNNVKIKSLTRYEIKRGTDMIDLTLNISIPSKNFETIN